MIYKFCYLFLSVADIKGIYEKVTTPPLTSPPPTPQPKRSVADWERDQREVSQEQEGRDTLRKKRIPTYFDSEFGKAFLLSQVNKVSSLSDHYHVSMLSFA